MPEAMKTYEVRVMEVWERVVTVKATDRDHAEEMVKNGEYPEPAEMVDDAFEFAYILTDATSVEEKG